MPWNSQNGSGGGWQGGGRGPWGQGPGGGGSGGGGPQPPNLEELLRRGQDQLKAGLPGGGKWGRKGILLAVLVAIGAWLLSGFYTVQPDEQGVVMRFGKFIRTVGPGLNYHLPSPIESVEKPKVTRENQDNFGFRDASDLVRSRNQELTEESHMLTGDENIVDIQFAVVWRIGDAADYLFNIQQPRNTIRAVAESVVREVVGRTKIDDVLTEGREQIEIDSKELMQATLNAYGAGIDIVRVKMQKADPPAEVIDSFRDVQRARADQERLRNEAQAYANKIIPTARGESEQIRQAADGYREQVVSEAKGESSRYLAILKEYQQSKDIIRERMYLETLEDVFAGMNKVVIGNQDNGSGVVPYLPLPELQKRRQGATE